MTDSLGHALDALQRGLLIGLPTDTVYGIAVDPFERLAMDRLFEVKGRARGSAIPILGASAADLERVARISSGAVSAAADHWPGALTLVVPVGDDVPAWIGDERRTVAIRVPDHPVALGVLTAAGPLAVTSANRSGLPPAQSEQEARVALGYGVAVYLAGEPGRGEASTVVDLTGAEPVVLRQGPVRFPA